MSTLDRPGVGRARSSGRSRPAAVTASISMLAFWAAIALPAVYLPLLASGIDTTSGLAVFLGLFGLHVLALVGGRSHAGSSGS